MPDKRLFLAWALLLALGSRVAVAVVGSVQELWGYGPTTVRLAVTLDEDQRIGRKLGLWEATLGYPVGRELQIFTTLRDALPADAVLFVVSTDLQKLNLTFGHLNVLLAPRQLLPSNAIPPNWRTTASALGRRCFVLEYAGKLDFDFSAAFERIADGQDFVLWRYKGPGK